MLSIPQSNDITDSECVYFAYLKWGTDAVTHLKGDWSFAAYDENEQRLMLARDQYGITSIYYAIKGNTLYFSSLIQAISVFDYFGKDINLRRLAELICSSVPDGYSSFFENIKILSPAHFLLFDQRLQRVNYWQPTVKVQYGRKEADVHEELRYLLHCAVERRMPKYGNLGISQSGGFDSNAVAAFAAMIAAEKGEKIYCYTAVPKYDVSNFPMKHRNPDEGDIAASLARMYPNVVHKRVSDGPYSVITGIEKALEAHGQPVHAVINAHWIFNNMNVAKEDGCTTMLNGQNGNFTISWPAGRFEKRWYKRSLSKIYDNYVPEFIQKKRYRHLEQGNNDYLYSSTNKKLHPYIQEVKRLKEQEYLWRKKATLKEKQVNALRFGKNAIGQLLFETAFSEGINSFDPTIDPDVIHFCLSLPDEFYQNNKDSRLLIKKGLQNILPTEILEQKTRGLQSADMLDKVQHDFLFEKASDGYMTELFNFASFNNLLAKVIESKILTNINIAMRFYAIDVQLKKNNLQL